MLNLKIEDAADDVRAAHELKNPPINVVGIAEREGIVLAPSPDFGPEFHGRVEFRPDKRKFILFYPTQGDGTISARQRFNVAHELAHYFLETHREALMRGVAHN